MKSFLIYFTVINISAFLLYGLDKKKAEIHQYRIPEFTLLLLGFFGAELGSTLGMIFFKHKLSKRYFIYFLIFFSIIHLVILFSFS